jgi:uncharacterized protein
MATRADRYDRSPRRELLGYAVLVTLLSTVFYVVGPLLGTLSAVTKSNVPAAALMFGCPTIAAVVLARRSRRTRELFSAMRVPVLPWYFWLATILLMPVAVIWASVLSGADDFAVPSVLSAGLLAVIYLVSALGEEIGWTGYALPRLLSIHGEFASALILGMFWAAWHIIPFWEAGNSATWIVGQCLFSVVLRLVLVRLTVLARMSIWPAVVCHAMYNLAWSLSPAAGAHYSPWIVATVVACAVAFLYLVRSPSPGTRDLRP